jgi:hypothetical protein
MQYTLIRLGRKYQWVPRLGFSLAEHPLGERQKHSSFRQPSFLQPSYYRQQQHHHHQAAVMAAAATPSALFPSARDFSISAASASYYNEPPYLQPKIDTVLNKIYELEGISQH